MLLYYTIFIRYFEAFFIKFMFQTTGTFDKWLKILEKIKRASYAKIEALLHYIFYYFLAANHSATALASSPWINPAGIALRPLARIFSIPAWSSLVPTLVRSGPTPPSRF